MEQADGVIFCSHYLYNPWYTFPEAGRGRQEGFRIKIFSLSEVHEVRSQELLDRIFDAAEGEDFSVFLFQWSLENLSFHSDKPEEVWEVLFPGRGEVLNRLIRIMTEGKEVWVDVPSWEREKFGRLKRQWKKWR